MKGRRPDGFAPRASRATPWSLAFALVVSACGPTSSPGGATLPSPPPTGTPTGLIGKLGALGAVQATASSFVISNSGETLVYLSSATISCEQIRVSRWLGSVTPGAQVVEIVVRGAPKVGTLDVPPNEVNFGEGGKSSAGETVADSGSIRFTKAEANGVVEGTVVATYGSGESLEGHFRAEFCSDGQGY